VGLILDFAVVAIAVVVVVSLSTLTWTLAVSVVASVARARRSVAESRRGVGFAEARLGKATHGARDSMARWIERTRAGDGSATQGMAGKAGDGSHG
jgi:hypothetical protein